MMRGREGVGTRKDTRPRLPNRGKPSPALPPASPMPYPRKVGKAGVLGGN